VFGSNRNRIPGFTKDDKDLDRAKEFRVALDRNTSIYFMEIPNKKIQVIIKKELLDYNIDVVASEAPVKNPLVKGEIIPYEYVIAETAILEQELFKLNETIKNVFGTKFEIKVTSIRLCVGNEENYHTIDESDLKEVNIDPTIDGLKHFITTSKKNVFGFTIRNYDTKQGNLIFCEGELLRPIYDLYSLKIKILTNLSQRGLYMQQHHLGYGLHLYYVFTLSKFSDLLVRFFSELGIPIEMIYLKRKSSIQNWRAIECELDEKNLKNYLQFNYTSLSHSDVEQIVSIIKANKFDFEVANMMADLLNRMKLERVEVQDGLFSLEQEDIAAAATVATKHFGFKSEKLSLPFPNLDVNIIKKSIEELDRYIH
jgi:hypothetical protein